MDQFYQRFCLVRRDFKFHLLCSNEKELRYILSLCDKKMDIEGRLKLLDDALIKVSVPYAHYVNHLRDIVVEKIKVISLKFLNTNLI